MLLGSVVLAEAQHIYDTACRVYTSHEEQKNYAKDVLRVLRVGLLHVLFVLPSTQVQAGNSWSVFLIPRHFSLPMLAGRSSHPRHAGRVGHRKEWPRNRPDASWLVTLSVITRCLTLPHDFRTAGLRPTLPKRTSLRTSFYSAEPELRSLNSLSVNVSCYAGDQIRDVARDLRECLKLCESECAVLVPHVSCPVFGVW